MITSQTISQLATKLQTTQLNVRREYVQHLFLSHFYQQPQSTVFLFKGGTALRLLHGSPRFSEDLDFDCILPRFQQAVIEELLEKCLVALQAESVPFALEEAKGTSGGYLALLTFQVDQQPVRLQLEISLRSTQKTGELLIVASDFLPPYTAYSLALDTLVAEKITALLNRQKARDFYDLYFILRRGLLPTSEKSRLAAVLQLLAKQSMAFEQELREFLPASQRAIISHFQEVLTLEIQRQMGR